MSRREPVASQESPEDLSSSTRDVAPVKNDTLGLTRLRQAFSEKERLFWERKAAEPLTDRERERARAADARERLEERRLIEGIGAERGRAAPQQFIDSGRTLSLLDALFRREADLNALYLMHSFADFDASTMQK